MSTPPVQYRHYERTSLTTRQCQVLQLRASGYHEWQIAVRLGVKLSTVKNTLVAARASGSVPGTRRTRRR